MVGLFPVLLGLLSAGGSELLSTRVQGLLSQHPMTTCLPGVKPLLDTPLDCVGCGDMTILLQYHRLKDNEPLLVTKSVLHPMQIFHQGHHKASPDLPTWRVVVPVRHDRKFMPPTLPNLIVTNASMKVISIVGVNPVPVDLLELEFLQGRGVAR